MNRIVWFFLDGGMIIARNIPYKATDSAETIMDGKIFPNMIPQDVPIAHGSTEAAMAP